MKYGYSIFKRIVAGWYEAETVDGSIWTIRKFFNEDRFLWSVRENGDHHDYFPTLKAAKNYVASASCNYKLFLGSA